MLVLQHPDEQSHALNTARLAVLGLRNAQLQVGEIFEPLPPDVSEAYRIRLLFPGERAAVLPLPDSPQEKLRPLLLVVPDGTWRKARKLLHLNPWLAALPRVSLPEGRGSRYRLRKAPAADALSTIEAIALALELQEACDYSALLRPFEALIEGQIEAMGAQTFRRNHCREDRGL